PARAGEPGPPGHAVPWRVALLLLLTLDRPSGRGMVGPLGGRYASTRPFSALPRKCAALRAWSVVELECFTCGAGHWRLSRRYHQHPRPARRRAAGSARREVISECKRPA